MLTVMPTVTFSLLSLGLAAGLSLWASASRAFDTPAVPEALPFAAANEAPADPPRSLQVIRSTAPATSPRPRARKLLVPEARWGTGPRELRWTLSGLRALKSHADTLPEIVPRDIEAWCPAYPQASRPEREAFWVGLASAMAKHESTYRPRAVGGGGQWFGLLQILPATARQYNCRARSGEALKSGAANLSCAFRIMARTVARDRVVSAGMRGVAADWGPFHSREKRRDMMAWTNAQPYCQKRLDTRPVARPARLAVGVRNPGPRDDGSWRVETGMPKETPEDLAED